MLYFLNLGKGSLKSWDEGLTAVRSLELYKTEDILTAQAHNQITLNKPTLYYVITAFFYSIFGINEFSVRLLSCIFSACCFIFVYLISENATKSSLAGAISAICLLLTPHWANETRQGLLESGFVLSMLSFMYISLYRKKSFSSGLIAGMALSLGTLIKNPLVCLAILPCATNHIINYKKQTQAQKRNILRFWKASLLVLFTLGMSWYYYNAITHTRLFIDRYLVYNVLDRTLIGIEGHGRFGFFYYPSLLLKRATVNAVFFTFSLLYIIKNKLIRDNRIIPFIIIIFLWLFLIQFSVSKRHTYLVPLYPFTSIVIGIVIHDFSKDFTNYYKSIVFISLTFLMTVAFFFMPKYSYLPVLDFNRDLKQIFYVAKKHMKSNDEITTINIPGQLLSFYTRETTYYNYKSKNSLDEIVKIAQSKQNGKYYIIINRRLLNKRINELTDLICTTHQVNILFINSKYALLVFEKIKQM